jgi:hypothetical protein
MLVKSLQTLSFPLVMSEALVAGPYSLRTVRGERVPLGRCVSISSHGRSYLLALHRIWSLSERIIGQ